VREFCTKASAADPDACTSLSGLSQVPEGRWVRSTRRSTVLLRSRTISRVRATFPPPEIGRTEPSRTCSTFPSFLLQSASGQHLVMVPKLAIKETAPTRIEYRI
jgi:hypothetical protein